MIAMDAIRDIVRVTLPSVTSTRKATYCELFFLALDETHIEARLYIRREHQDGVSSIRLECDGLSVDVSLTRIFRSSGASHEIHAPNASISGEELNLGDGASWKTHPALLFATDTSYHRQVATSWRDCLLLREEASNAQGEVVRPGFRLPQVGALHAVAAHWSVKSTHAKVVLPTGTGKTDVMIAASVMKPSSRTLLLVPSDALRTQLSDRFAQLGMLRRIGAVRDSALNPVMGRLSKSPGSIDDILMLRSANVVVSTTHMLLSSSDDLLREFLSWFDLVMFDEAHHLPSNSWTRISRLASKESKVLSVTATPYRNDKRRVPGEMIYQFPLKLAQEYGYFSTISVLKVDELDSNAADFAIARSAVRTLIRDEEEHGYRHLIMARARTKEHADALFGLYSSNYPELNPVLLYSGIGTEQKRAAMEGITNLAHRVVVCVDMLGEGIDIPSLKIAALHDSHKSLPVTLQFIGRFTRSSSTTGSATIVVNIADPMADSAIAELFAEDADWNYIVPELSARAVGGEESTSAFISMMQALADPEDKKFDLGLITAKANVSFHSALHFHPGRVEAGLSKTSRLHQSWVSEDNDLVILITQDLKYPSWSTSKEAMSFDWNLSIISHDETNSLLYVNSTYGDSRVSRLARAVSGSSSVQISGERMFRVFDGLHRSVLYNVGLYRRGQVRFQMLAGKDIGEQVSTAIQAGSTKSNLFAMGYEDGAKVSIGASFKGRVWSMGSFSIPDWREWCRKIATKVKNDSIATDSFLRFTLIPHEVSSPPEIPIFACMLPDEFFVELETNRRVSVADDTEIYNQLDISFGEVRRNGDEIHLEIPLGSHQVTNLALRWSPDFSVHHQSGPRIFIGSDSGVISLDEFFTSHPPALLLSDGSELVGKHHFRYPEHLPYTFSAESILPLDWGDVPIRVESKWKHGHLRPSSIQGHMISKLVEQENSIVFDDDDKGEAADIIVLTDNREAHELEVTLYHCKYATGDSASARYGDLYEVCGQAVKSSRLVQRPEVLIRHMLHREERLGGRPTRFEKGTLNDLRSLHRRIHKYRTRTSISIVQPGLSATALTAELSTVLAAADGFILEFTGRRLKVFGSG